MWEVGKGCSETKRWYWFTNSNMARPGKYDHIVPLSYKTTTNKTIFNLVINFLVVQCMLNSLLEE